jgi:DNA-binding transcriptional MerR regulator
MGKPMSEKTSYTLEELAGMFNLTPRTARHYIENVLPPQHKTGRGRRAHYGQDAWNCFAFIRRARQDKLTMAQISDLLGTLGQAQIERVAGGLEDLAIVPTAPEPREVYSSPCMAGEFDEAPGEACAPSEPIPRWQLLYLDDDLQITHRGQASQRQREQVRMAAGYIKRILASDP